MHVSSSTLARATALLLALAFAPRCSTAGSTPGGPVEPGPPPTVGALELTIRETGASPDPDGYTVDITLRPHTTPLERLLAPLDFDAPDGDLFVLRSLAPGSYTLHVDGLAPHCSVPGKHPRAFVILAGATTELEVFVFCPGPGAILVTTTTRGRDVGAAGYGISILGDAAAEFTIGVNDSLLIGEEELPAGTQWFVNLTGAPDNCRVDLPPTRVAALKGATVRRDYAIVCIPRGTRIAYEVQEAVLLTGGSATVQVGSDLAGALRRPSLSPDRSRVVLTTLGDVNQGSGLVIVRVDGGRTTWLTSEGQLGYVGSQAWSPDGSRIVFSKQTGLASDVHVVNADGSGERRLTHDGASYSPAWSPDGSTIAFCRFKGDPLEEVPYLYRMSATDGSGVTRIFEGGCDPTWSPDGSRIAFTSYEDMPDLAVIRADGSGFTRLHPASMRSAETSQLPTWSPDGSLIAYVTGLSGNRIWMVSFDGTGFGEPFPFLFGAVPSWR